MLVAIMETVMVSALSQSILFMTTKEGTHHDITNTKGRITEAHTGHTFILQLTQIQQCTLTNLNGAIVKPQHCQNLRFTSHGFKCLPRQRNKQSMLHRTVIQGQKIRTTPVAQHTYHPENGDHRNSVCIRRAEPF